MRVQVLGAAALAAALSGCAGSHLVYVNDMTMGVDVSYSNEGVANVVLGFERDTFALVPQKKVGERYDELMSLSAASKMSASGLQTIDFDHFIATGESAKQIGTDIETMKNIRNKIIGTAQAPPAVVAPIAAAEVEPAEAAAEPEVTAEPIASGEGDTQ